MLTSDPEARDMRRKMQTTGVEEGAYCVIRILRTFRVFFDMGELRVSIFQHFPINNSTVFFLPFRAVLELGSNVCVCVFGVQFRYSSLLGSWLDIMFFRYIRCISACVSGIFSTYNFRLFRADEDAYGGRGDSSIRYLRYEGDVFYMFVVTKASGCSIYANFRDYFSANLCYKRTRVISCFMANADRRIT